MQGTLNQLLKRVSRSFYLSIQVLPGPVRGPIAVGYLVARAADSIADTEAVPPEQRLELLRALRDAALDGGGDAGSLTRWALELIDAADPGAPPSATEDERRLLGQLGACLGALGDLPAEDRERVRRVLRALLSGMERDLSRFPPSRGGTPPELVVALETLADLDEYTYFAAGCVGEFWSELCAARLPGLEALATPPLLSRGISLGKALQMVNVIRDAPADLRSGRCYWPEEVLRPAGLSPMALARLAQPGAAAPGPEVRRAVLEVTARLMTLGTALAEEAWPYVQAIPPAMVRLRLACTWPLLLGLDTLRLIRAHGSPLLVPDRVLKVRRGAVRALLWRSSAAALGDWLAPGARLDRLRGRYHTAVSGA